MSEEEKKGWKCRNCDATKKNDPLDPDYCCGKCRLADGRDLLPHQLAEAAETRAATLEKKADVLPPPTLPVVRPASVEGEAKNYDVHIGSSIKSIAGVVSVDSLDGFVRFHDRDTLLVAFNASKVTSFSPVKEIVDADDSDS